MADDDPNCPRCTGPVRSDWDWCQNCGYDPEGLKPIGWIPAPPPEPQAPGRRRSRRAKGGTRSKGQANPAIARSTLLVLPAPVLDLTRIAEPVRPAPVAPAAAGRVEPQDRVRPSPQPTRSPAGPQPVSRRTELPLSGTPAVASEFSLPASGLELGIAATLVALAALLIVVAVSSLGSLVGGTTLNSVATGVFILVCLALGAGLAAQAYALIKVRVVISPTHVTAKNRLGRPRKADLAEIFSVTLSTRHFDVGFGRTHAAEVPYVQVSDGAGFWIDALGGRSGQPPTGGQRAVLDRLNRIVATHRPVPPPLDLPT